MHKKMSLTDYMVLSAKNRQRRQQAHEDTQKMVERAKTHAFATIQYPNFKEAYEYVDNLFPGAHVKEVTVYRVAASVLYKIGVGFADGFYDPVSKSVIVGGERKRSSYRPRSSVCNVMAKIERDEVMVHELCHYAYVAEGNRTNSTEIMEEFAYGWSLGYLRSKGYSDDYIIKYNYFPFLVQIAFPKAIRQVLSEEGISRQEYQSYARFKRKEFYQTYERRIFKIAKEMATERGKRLVNLYDRNMKKGTNYVADDDGSDRWDLLDL